MRELCAYWADTYDWRATESRLNAHPQFLTEIDDLDIHVLHARSPYPDALPLVLTHGWPGSIVEFQNVLGPLTDPVAYGGEASDAFHVVCPSLPGYGFSGKPTASGWGVERIARAWADLMGRLGYERYGAQGGDWGSSVTTRIGQLDAGHVVGIHLNMPVVAPTSLYLEDMSDTEQAAVVDMAEYQQSESGYAKQQATRPQPLGCPLVGALRFIHR